MVFNTAEVIAGVTDDAVVRVAGVPKTKAEVVEEAFLFFLGEVRVVVGVIVEVPGGANEKPEKEVKIYLNYEAYNG